MTLSTPRQSTSWDAIAIGSGIGGLTAAALLARYGWRVLVCESHSIPGGAAHGFSRRGFRFDSGPSFYCGLSDPQSINPLRQVLDTLGETVAAIAYDPLGHYHFPEGTLPIYSSAKRYRVALHDFARTYPAAGLTDEAIAQFSRLEQRMLRLYNGLREIPTLALRSDFNLIGTLLSRYPLSLLKLLPLLGDIGAAMGDLLDQEVHHPWLRRLIDLECFLLSGLKAAGTVAPEMAFMFGERSHSVVDYPVGGSGAIVEALIRGLEKWGGTLRLNAHVEQICLEQGKVCGVRLRNGEILRSTTVISNATLWDTYTHLLNPEDLPASDRQTALATPAIDSFMHLHLGIRADGLEELTGHHVVVHDSAVEITTPGNTCMISIPSIWDSTLAPTGHHTIHAYTLEPFQGWQRDETYETRKRDRVQPLYRALQKVIPDVGDRVVLELIGTPLTHARYLRRHQGTYGPAIAAKQAMFPTTHTPIPGLYRVGDSTLPGIGVPAVAASGILCANTLVKPSQTTKLLNLLKR